MKLIRNLAWIGVLCISLNVGAQKKNTSTIKFGEIKPELFSPNSFEESSPSNAVILSDVGHSKFIGNNRGDFSIEFNRHKRIRLINKNGFDEATVEIPLYTDGRNVEKLESIEAVTYNLENGMVIATKLDKSSVFNEKYDEKHEIRKFTFPNIKEGSIVEFRYRVSSPFYFNFQPWTFQKDIPCLWSEYKATIPNDIFDYIVMKNGYLPYVIDTATASIEIYSIASPGTTAYDRQEVSSIRSKTVTGHWAMQNIPALKSENFISSLDNYVSKIEFQLRRIKYSATHSEEIMGDWNQLVTRLMKRETFGEPLNKNNGWMQSDLKKITLNNTGDLEKAKSIFEYIRDNFTCKGNKGIYLSNTLKTIFTNKNGYAADLNLLLIAAMKNQDIEATPVLLSTRNNGWAVESYPLIDRFNYVLCRVKIKDKYYLLDAAQPNLGFGKLSGEMYNRSARIIDAIPILIDLSADSLKELKRTTMFIINGKDKKIEGSFSSTPGYLESLEIRDKLGKTSKEDFFKNIQKGFSFEIGMTNQTVDSLNLYEHPVSLKYTFDFDFKDEEIVYFNPMMGEAQKNNPFAAAERYYPVEMPACLEETFVLNMEIPEGYEVDEIPKSTRVKLNDDEGMFEYLIEKSKDRIQLRSNVLIKKATFDPEDYATLRDFFAFMVKKQAEPIVFKKIK